MHSEEGLEASLAVHSIQREMVGGVLLTLMADLGLISMATGENSRIGA